VGPSPFNFPGTIALTGFTVFRNGYNSTTLWVTSKLMRERSSRAGLASLGRVLSLKQTPTAAGAGFSYNQHALSYTKKLHWTKAVLVPKGEQAIEN